MKVTKYSSSQINVILSGTSTSTSTVSNSVRPYNLVQENQLIVGVAPVLIAAPPAGLSYTFLIINRSAAAQILRTGFAPTFGPNVGISILVNEVIVWESLNFGLSIVANVAGALADVLVLSQTL